MSGIQRSTPSDGQPVRMDFADKVKQTASALAGRVRPEKPSDALQTLVADAAHLRQETMTNTRAILVEKSKTSPNPESIKWSVETRNELIEKKKALQQNLKTHQPSEATKHELVQIEKDLAVTQKFLEKQEMILEGNFLKEAGPTKSSAKVSQISWLASGGNRGVNKRLEGILAKVDLISKGLVSEAASGGVKSFKDTKSEIDKLEAELAVLDLEAEQNKAVWPQSALDNYHEQRAQVKDRLEALNIELAVLKPASPVRTKEEKAKIIEQARSAPTPPSAPLRQTKPPLPPGPPPSQKPRPPPRRPNT